MLTSDKAGTSSFNAWTYGKKSGLKKRQLLPSSAPQKRQKLSDESESVTDAEQGSPAGDDLEWQTALPGLAKDSFRKFEPMIRTSLPSTPTKLAKSMLARSKTDSSLDTPSRSPIDRTPSMPNLPSSSSQKGLTTSNPDSTSTFQVSAPNVTRTYAGTSRSFLIAIPAAALDDAFPAVEQEDEYSRESYASLRSRWGVDNSEDDPYLVDASDSPSRSNTPKKSPRKNWKGKVRPQHEGLLSTTSLPTTDISPVKSITELRSKGESRRFFDEVGYLFEGMDSNGGAGLKRVSALEITTKLCDIDFARKAKAADFLGKIWQVFVEAGAGKGDKILDTILAFFCALLSRDPSSLIELAQRSIDSISESEPQLGQSASSLVDILFSLLSSPDDPLALVSASAVKSGTSNELQLRKMNVGKKEKSLLLTIISTIESRSHLFPRGTQISTSLLLIRSLQTLPSSLIPTNHLPALLSSLQKCLSNVLPNPSLPSAYLSWSDKAPSIPYQNVYYHLRLLDAYLLRQWCPITVGFSNNDEDAEGTRKSWKNKNECALKIAREDWLVGALVATGICAELYAGRWAQTCTEMVLRVLVSVTHSDEVWAQKVLDQEPSLGFILRLIFSDNGRVVDVNGRDPNGTCRQRANRNPDEETQYASNDEVSRSGPQDSRTHELDKLCLALGLLTNLVQTIDGMKDTLRTIRLSPVCSLTQSACIRSCICPGGASVSAVDILVQLYGRLFSMHERLCSLKVESGNVPSSSVVDPDTPDVLFLRGHLAVLFGLLMDGNPQNQRCILKSLQGVVGSDKVILSQFAEQAREFVAFYDALNGGETEDRDKNGARDILSFLEGLRDSALAT